MPWTISAFLQVLVPALNRCLSRSGIPATPTLPLVKKGAEIGPGEASISSCCLFRCMRSTHFPLAVDCCGTAVSPGLANGLRDYATEYRGPQHGNPPKLDKLLKSLLLRRLQRPCHDVQGDPCFTAEPLGLTCRLICWERNGAGPLDRGLPTPAIHPWHAHD